MTTTPKDGGPAFPTPNECSGMSFRQYAAVAAMQGILASAAGHPDARGREKQVLAIASVQVADALITELERTK